MADYSIRHELDTIIKNTETYNENLIPTELLSNLKKWKWGSYGWVSPASLMFTATWRKYYYPSVDCCMIWSKMKLNNQYLEDIVYVLKMRLLVFLY